MRARLTSIAVGYLALAFVGCLNDPPTFVASFETVSDMAAEQIGNRMPQSNERADTADDVDQGAQRSPNAFSDSFTRFGSCQVSVAAQDGLLLNDRWSDGAIIDLENIGERLEIELVQPPLGGILQLGTDGSFTYSSTDPRLEVDHFSYRIRYEGRAGEQAKVFIRQPNNRIIIDSLEDAVAGTEQCTLRQAIARTNGQADVGRCLEIDDGPVHLVFANLGAVVFQPAYHADRLSDDPSNQTIFGETDAHDLFISKQVHIHGCGPELTILDGAGSQRHFHIGQNATLTLENLALINGRAELGGSILNEGILNTRGVRFANNRALGKDGASAIGAETPTDVLACNVLGSGGGGGGGAGIGGAIAGLRGSQTVLQSSADHPCRFTGNMAIGGKGGAISRVDVPSDSLACGGHGGGLGAGTGGFSHLQHDGVSAALMGGGGGGSPNGFYTYSGYGGDGGFGGGGGSGANLYLLTDGTNGMGGFGAGDGAEPPYGENGGGGGGGAGLGGAVGILAGQLVVDDCSFSDNVTRPGLGGRPANQDGLGRGADGTGLGDDIFTLRASHAIDTNLIDWIICEEVSDEGSAECAFDAP
ncbi:MAG: Ig-like domain-containing protein [Myxococcota bacterium]|nr:Ig-like domain-containing protein [Myxococcota bacterium]